MSLIRSAARCSVALSALLVLLLGGCADSGEWTRLEPPRPAADFTLPQLDGPPITLSELRGRVVLVEFWATWCGPCQMSTPSLDVIYRRYRDKGVSVLLVNQGESADEIRAWKKQRKLQAPILMDEKMEVSRLYQVTGIPTLLIIDQAGQLLYEHGGYEGRLEHNLKLVLDQLLAPAVPVAHGG